MAQDKEKIQQVIKKIEKASKLLRGHIVANFEPTYKPEDATIDESRFNFIFSLLVLKRISELTFSTHRRRGGCDSTPEK